MQVTVEDPKTGDAVDFPCRRWFAKNEDDGQISRELSRADGKDGDIVTDKGKCDMRVWQQCFLTKSIYMYNLCVLVEGRQLCYQFRLDLNVEML